MLAALAQVADAPAEIGPAAVVASDVTAPVADVVWVEPSGPVADSSAADDSVPVDAGQPFAGGAQAHGEPAGVQNYADAPDDSSQPASAVFAGAGYSPAPGVAVASQPSGADPALPGQPGVPGHVARLLASDAGTV